MVGWGRSVQRDSYFSKCFKKTQANISIFLAFFSNALIQMFRAAWAVNLQTYCCSAHKAMFWDKYMHISTWIINSLQLVLIATPLRLCTASIQNHQLLLFDHKLQWFELHENLSFHHKKHQTFGKLLQKIFTIWLRHTWEIKVQNVVRKKTRFMFFKTVLTVWRGYKPWFFNTVDWYNPLLFCLTAMTVIPAIFMSVQTELGSLLQSRSEL